VVRGLLETWTGYKIAVMILMVYSACFGSSRLSFLCHFFFFTFYLGSAPVIICRCLILRFTCHLRGIANIIINDSTAPDSHNHLSGSVGNG
jgi:hypothetical protein